jgi:pre-mRNA-processing factor 39
MLPEVFWERYVRYLEAQGSVEAASNALARAYNIHCKRRPEIYLFAARFNEAHQNVEAARTAYDEVLQRLAPGSLEAAIGKANFERRQVWKLFLAVDRYRLAR